MNFSSGIQANVEINESRASFRIGIVVQVRVIFAFPLCGCQGADDNFGSGMSRLITGPAGLTAAACAWPRPVLLAGRRSPGNSG